MQVADVQGHKMFLDPKDFMNLKRGYCEPVTTELVKREIKRGDTVVNIGACIGYFTLVFAKLVGEKGKVFAFEPEPENFKLLRKNVSVNGYQNVTLVQKAVSNKAGMVKLYLSETNPGDHRIYNPGDVRRFTGVETIRLDDYLEDYDAVNLIKMDIQGAEALAFQGMANVVKRSERLRIVMEFWPDGLKKAGTEPEVFLRLLIENGFELFDINEWEHKIEPFTPPELLEKYDNVLLRRVGKDFTNVFCRRR